MANSQRSSGTLVVQNLRDQAGRAIRAQIIAGDFEANRLYAIGKVAAELGVSSTPVREALLDLASEGLITMSRNRGFSVRVVTDDDLDELVELRRMIEAPTVKQIAERRLIDDDSELRDLASKTESSAVAGDLSRFLDFDREFHLRLLSYLGNERLVSIVRSLRDQGRLYGLHQIVGTPALLESTQEHQLLLDAVVEGRADDAVRLMNTHLDHARGIWAGNPE